MRTTVLGSSGAEWMKPLGLAVSGASSFLEASYLPLDDDLTVLYGLNGAGKSFILEGLVSCLSGVRNPRHGHGLFLLAQLPSQDEWPQHLANAFDALNDALWSGNQLGRVSNVGRGSGLMLGT